MEAIRRTRHALDTHGFKHILWRGIEYLSLQTRPTSKLYWLIVPRFYGWKLSRQFTQYPNPPSPIVRYEVDPNSIIRCSSRGTAGDGVLNDIGTVRSGKWDQRSPNWDENKLFYADRIDETLIYNAMKNRYKNDREWQETDFYEHVLQQVARTGSRWHGCASKAEVDHRCEQIDQLYEDIKEQGYKSQRDFREVGPSLSDPFGYINEYVMEVAVDVSRNGELLLVDGRHRLIIAQLLNLDEIPISIIVRHRQWIEQCANTETREINLIKQVSD